MIDIKAAKEIAYKKLQETYRDTENPPIIMDENTIVTSFGWVFFYNEKSYLEEGTIMNMYIGNAPIRVDKVEESAHYTGTAYDINHYIVEYEKICNDKK